VWGRDFAHEGGGTVGLGDWLRILVQTAAKRCWKMRMQRACRLYLYEMTVGLELRKDY
jgi:hypothetical protein